MLVASYVLLFNSFVCLDMRETNPRRRDTKMLSQRFSMQAPISTSRTGISGVP